MGPFSVLGGDGASGGVTPDTIDQNLAARFREAETRSFFDGPQAVSRRFAKIRQQMNRQWS